MREDEDYDIRKMEGQLRIKENEKVKKCGIYVYCLSVTLYK